MPASQYRGDTVDVIIAGCGPTGATMANLLGRRGWRVAVVERTPTPYDKPRAITADHEALRVFQEIGLADAIAEKTCAHAGTDFVGVQGQVIKRFYPAPPPYPLTWQPNWMFVQPELEAILRNGIKRYPNVQMLLEHDALDFEQDAQGVQVRVANLADGAQRILQARYLLACDGARSPIRSQLNLSIEDLAFDEWWLVVDMWQRGPVSLPERCVQYCRPSRPGTYIRGPGDLRRWEIKMLPAEKPEDFENAAAVLDVLGSFVDTANLELCRSAVYRFHALVGDEWRTGRVVLMGDAAHQMPPFLGQGMCAGIRDTVNLAWKLDAVLHERAPQTLLDTYCDERKTHVRTVVAHAKSFGQVIGELNEDAARERDRRLEAELAAGRAETVRQRFIPGLETGMIARDGDGRPAGGAGDLFPQPWVRTAAAPAWRRLDDVTGATFRIVVRDVQLWQRTPEGLREAWSVLGGSVWALTGASPATAGESEQGIPEFSERDELVGAWLRQHEAAAVVVRPDHYVYGAAADAHELSSIIEQLMEAFHTRQRAETSALQAA